MPNYKKATKEEIEERRVMVAELYLKGFTKPSMILKQKSIKNQYEAYKNPRQHMKDDLKEVKKTFKLYGSPQDIQETIGELIVQLELQKRNHWAVYQNIDSQDYDGKIKVMDKIQELDEKIAFYKGVDPNTAVAKTTDINISSNITPVFDPEMQKKILKDEGIE